MTPTADTPKTPSQWPTLLRWALAATTLGALALDLAGLVGLPAFTVPCTVFALLLLHVLEIWCYGIAYYWLEHQPDMGFVHGEHGIRTLFDVPQAAVRVWTVAGPYIDADFTQGASEDARAFASSLTMPFCGPNLGFEPAGWLAQEAGEPAQSLALLPLREGAIDSATPAFGLLVLGSPDPQRFDATMGTEFLSRIAELASAALVRLK